MTVLVTRPYAQAERTARRLDALGHDSLIAPLLEIVPQPWATPEMTPDLILITSANAVRAAIPPTLLDIPVLAMGSASAAAARDAGFMSVETSNANGAAALYRLAAKGAPGRALHLCGRDLTAAGTPPGLHLERITTYRAELLPLSADAASALADGGINMTLLYSQRTALHFLAELERLDIPRANQHVTLLGIRPPGFPPGGWASMTLASAPTEDSLFAAANLLHRNHSAA
ncbi:MAG: uroporphyrinogen-III synthase [Pacificimonas sp.]